MVVPDALNDLRGKVLRGAAEGIRHVAGLLLQLGQSEVCKLKVSMLV